jgi:chromosome segregation ATPase
MKLEELENKLGEYESRLDKSSKDVIEAKEKEIATLKEQVSIYTQTQESLLSEIQALSKSWSALEELNSKKIFDRAQLEELQSKHKEEKTKMEHKCAHLSKLALAAENSQKAMSKQSAKQLELIVKLQGMEKNLSEQLSGKEKELAARNVAHEEEKKKVVDFMTQVETLRKQVQDSSQKLDNLSSLLRSKTEALEMEGSIKRKLEDQVSSLKHKVEVINKDGDVGLRDQLDNYKVRGYILFLCICYPFTYRR